MGGDLPLDNMGYYDEYIRDRAEELFNQEKAKFAVYDRDHNEVTGCLDSDLNEQLFVGAMREMVKYLYERRNKLAGDEEMGVLFDEENVDKIWITARGIEAPTVIVEYEETPDWYEMENADLREFYWHPKPALSGEWTAGYFQPR